MGSKATLEAFERVPDAQPDKAVILFVTGSFVGERFDEPLLYIVFLLMPI